MNARGIAACAAVVAIGLAGCGSTDSSGSVAVADRPTTSAVESAVTTPRLASMDNFRDIAGPGDGYTTADGKRVRHGVVYRSNAVTPNEADLATLNGLGIRAIYDLRTTAEVTATPDTPLPGAAYVRVNVMGDASDGNLAAAAAALSTPEQAADLLAAFNREFVTNAEQRAQLKTLLTDLAEGSGPQIVHCTAGKDRTGWATALLLAVAGVPRQTILDDYLLTNEYSRASIDATTAQVAQAKGPEAAAMFHVLLGVAPEYLQAGFDEVDRTYGGFDNYLTDGLGLTPESVANLKAKLTQ
ncbi:tyrosine-protein phosphatase [Antrihabitans sp. YC2-6]|uniref:tyrosine-protein phosphatase n=1 Tax=Antrihabitans sp. YC2-6 TaxID=2799498 RepID=UPI0018F6CA3A|nr:tyrosine-protein phosphatase [Antrihabitans sp. YC2-6]MBJ8346703.1 tyrosine-protein phosphatase [Antrihabitans sp. YC2-6]